MSQPRSDAQTVIGALALVPHEVEGGYYRETYRSPKNLPAGYGDGRYEGARSVATAIYYLLTDDDVSPMHRLPSDEILHFYCGDPVEVLELIPGGSSRLTALGTDVGHGEVPQAVMAAGTWFGARVVPGGAFALLGATMAPGFDFRDLEVGNPDELAGAYSERAELVRTLAV